MSIFESWLKKKQLPKQPEITRPVEPEKPKDLFGVGWDVIYTMEPDEEKRRKLYNSLEREERFLLGRGSLFVSAAEVGYFLKVMQELDVRPVIVFDFEHSQNPGEDLRHKIEEYENTTEKPIVFVKNYFQNLANQLDPRSEFDSWLRGRVQNHGWAAVIHGGRHAPGLSGNIAGSSSSTAEASEEDRARRDK